MRKKLTAIILALPLLITGCWDKVELESRGFVVTIGLDKYKADKETAVFEGNKNTNRYTVAMALPNLEELMGTGGKEKNKTVKTSANETVSAAMKLIDSYSSKKLYFGQTKTAVLGEELLKDEKLFREAADSMERNRELSRKMFMLSTKDDIKEVLAGSAPGEPLVGVFVANFYKNDSSAAAVTFRQDLENIARQLRFSGDVLIPEISLEGEGENAKIKLGGAAVLKDFALAGWIDDRQTRGYLWAKSQSKGAQLVAAFEDSYVPLRVNRSKAKTRFYEENERIVCEINVKIEGVVEEFQFSDRSGLSPEKLEELSGIYERLIAEEIADAFYCFQKEYVVDGFELEDQLRKTNYGLYLKHKDNFEAAFRAIELRTAVKVKITGTGIIKA